MIETCRRSVLPWHILKLSRIILGISTSYHRTIPNISLADPGPNPSLSLAYPQHTPFPHIPGINLAYPWYKPSKKHFLLHNQYFCLKVLGKQNGPKTSITIEKGPKKGKTLVKCAFLCVKAQILRNIWKKMRNCTVATFRNSAAWYILRMSWACLSHVPGISLALWNCSSNWKTPWNP